MLIVTKPLGNWGSLAELRLGDAGAHDVSPALMMCRGGAAEDDVAHLVDDLVVPLLVPPGLYLVLALLALDWMSCTYAAAPRLAKSVAKRLMLSALQWKPA